MEQEVEVEEEEVVEEEYEIEEEIEYLDGTEEEQEDDEEEEENILPDNEEESESVKEKLKDQMDDKNDKPTFAPLSKSNEIQSSKAILNLQQNSSKEESVDASPILNADSNLQKESTEHEQLDYPGTAIEAAYEKEDKDADNGNYKQGEKAVEEQQDDKGVEGGEGAEDEVELDDEGELDEDDEELSEEIDDSELMLRLDAKYGKLPAREYESDEDSEDASWTRN